MAPTLHAVRFKGVVVGNLTAAEIADRLRAGELSLAHVVRHQDRWMTLRQFFRENTHVAPPPPGTSLLGRLAGKPTAAGDHPPPPPGANPVGDAIEGRVREGYLWCGLTFVLPLAIGSPIWGLGRMLDLRNAAVVILLLVAALAGSGYAAWRAHRTSLGLESEGLHDVGRSMRQLALALAIAASSFWILVTLLWIAR